MIPIVPQSSNVINIDQEKTASAKSPQMKRPSTLILDCNRVETATLRKADKTREGKQAIAQPGLPKALYRSYSSSLHKRQSTFVPAATTSASNKFKLSSELDQIFVISSSRSNDADEKNYDSIDVIDERRMKNMPKSDRARLYKSNTFICEEYYTDEQLANVMNTDSTNEDRITN